MALDLRTKRAEEKSSASSPNSKQVLNIPKVSPLPALALPTADSLSSLALSLGIPLGGFPSTSSLPPAGLSMDSLANLNLQPLSQAEESAIQRELSKLKDDWSKHRTELSMPKSRRFDGSRGVGWTTIGDVIVPYIMRGPTKYVSTKIVEAKLLSTLHGVNLEKMSHAGPLYSYYITEQEARLFTEINNKCYSQQFGPESFTTQDLIVSLAEFERFYNNLRKQCTVKHEPADSDDSSPRSQSNTSTQSTPLIQDFNDTSIEGVEGGWLQINNTVVPYVFRNGVKFVPLCVIKYAAGLLTDVRIDGYKTPCTEMEYQYLNNACRQHGVNFSFLKSTKFIKLELVIRLSNWKVTIKELPTDDPFTQATYQSDVREPIVGFPIPSSPDLAPNQNPALFQIPGPLGTSGAESFPLLTTPVTAIASHALQFFNAAASSNLLMPCFPDQIASSVGSSLAPEPTAPVASSSSSSLISASTPSSSCASAPVIVVAPTSSNPSASIPSASIPSSSSNKMLSDPSKKLPTFHKRRSPAASSRLASHRVVDNYFPPPPPSQVGQPNKIVIECKEFQGKTIPCLLRCGLPENSFVLVESVMRLYFPSVGLDQFMDVLQAIMDVTIVHLKSVEEQAFIRFYNLPVKAMRYKYMMRFQDLQRTYYSLTDYFASGLLPNSGTWSKMKGKSPKYSQPTKNNRKAQFPPKVILDRNVKIEPSQPTVSYVLDNKVVGKVDSGDDSCSGSDSDNSINLEEERSALMNAYTNRDSASPVDRENDAETSKDNDNLDQNSVAPAEHNAEECSAVSDNDTSKDNVDKSPSSQNEADFSENSDSEEKIDVESVEEYQEPVDESSHNSASNSPVTIDNTSQTLDTKNPDKNHNDMDTNHSSQKRQLEKNPDDTEESHIPEKKLKTSSVNKLESALAKLKQRQKEKLVGVDEDV